MNKSLILLILVVALGGGSVGLYLHQQNIHEQQNATFEQEKEALEREQQRLSDLAEQKEQDLLRAEEATRLAEAKAAAEAKKREALVNQLNERLKAEAAQREAAEEALDQLEIEKEKLALAQKDLEERFSKLESSQTVAVSTESLGAEKSKKAEMAEALEAQKARMDQLESENERLRQEYEAALEKQLKTAEEIVKAGGRPVIPNPTIRSLNDRRKHAVYLKERSLGTINKEREVVPNDN
jgi:colicin import membrane protein